MTALKTAVKSLSRFVAGLMLLTLSVASLADSTESASSANPRVLMTTNMGDIELELFQDAAPVSVENFLTYIDAKHYDGMLFHRVIDNFMIQGGGYTTSKNMKATLPPISNEAHNGLKNERGTLAMARRQNPNSATSQFFINLVHNDFLDYGRRGYGYAVFGKVTQGMDVVDTIAKVKTSEGNWPVEQVVIISVKRVLDNSSPSTK